MTSEGPWGNPVLNSVWNGGGLTIRNEIPFIRVLMETELEEANVKNHDMSSCEEKGLAVMRYVMANFTREGWLKPINK